MKKVLLTVLGLIAITLTISGCQMFSDSGSQKNTFILTGEIIYVDDEPTTEHEFRVTIASVEVDTVDEAEEIPSMEITSGVFKNRKIRLRGSVDHPVPVTLSVWKEEELISSAKVLLQPNSKNKVEFLLTANSQDIYLKGTDHRSTNPERKFTLSGDLKEFGDYHPELTMVRVYGRTYELDGSTEYKSYGPVLVDNGKFSFEGDLNKPTLFSIWIEELNSYSMITLIQGIFEPGFNYRMEQVENTGTIVISADREGLHTQLVTDWLDDPEYLEILKQQHLAYVEFAKSLETTDETDQESEIGVEDTEDEIAETPALTFATHNPPATECQHVDLSSVEVDTGGHSLFPPGYERVEEFRQQIKDRRIESLLPTIHNTDNLILAWMAFQLDPFGYDRDEQKLATLKELEPRFSEEFVELHIKPQIEEVVQRISVAQNEDTVVPGQLAPPFTLDNLEGEAVSLHNVLKENELVLVDFWASWCGPCIDSFPALKEMYSKYQNEGFEIVTISIDSTHEDWKIGFEENELPWIDVIDAADDGELKGWQAPMATAYGVNYIPKKFLIDTEGCILQLDLPTTELEKVLATRWEEESAE